MTALLLEPTRGSRYKNLQAQAGASPRPVKTKLILAILCTLLAACAGNVSPPPAVAARDVAGKWYNGDGLTVITLTLNRDSTYITRWGTDIGPAGMARGNWRLDHSRLTLAPAEETGIMQYYRLRILDVVPDKQHFVLVRPKDRRDFNKWGADPPYWCFMRIK